ncbi:urotensin-2 receptor-like [Platysternon megacephalum]|uniref:Urotensin-2 receptor-like n=1 Tax=Platysternon megacephalum TaxID=55544 RepID=A0A4D9DSP1_9SAUR|nr:urotensin-2 receptor-like [Platysternon megacephalum]
MVKNSAEYRHFLKDRQAVKTLWVTWFTNTSDIALMFGKYFSPSERMDFLLTAIDGMRDARVHDSVVARHMLHVILEVPGPSMERVSEAVRSMYHNLDSISEPLAQQELLRALVLLGYRYSEEVVITLLGCSLSCDSIAAEMWRMLTSHPNTTGKVLKELLNRLQEQPLRQYHVSQKEAGVAPLAATRALYKILQEQACGQKVKELFPQFYIALLFQITYTMEPSMQDIAWHRMVHNQEDTHTPLSPFRWAVKAMEALLQCAGYGDQVALIQKQGGWDMLMSSSTHHEGICLLPRAMVLDHFQERSWILHQLMAILDTRDDKRHVPAMAFFIKVGKLQRLLPDVLERLHEADRELIAKAITVLNLILTGMDRQSASPMAVQVAEKLLPFCYDRLLQESSKLRVLSITLFKHLLELVRRPYGRQMKEHVL